jgi:ComF family protein
VCVNCQNKIRFIPDWEDDRKGKGPLPGLKTGNEQHFISTSCSDSRHLAHYEGVLRECLHSLKYDENRGLGELFARWLKPLVNNASWQIDLVLPVPLSDQRFHERGYNQSALIARPLAAQLGVPYNAYGLKRVLNTPSQVGLSAEERRRNVAKAFYAEEAIVMSKSILLVDDVMTTGSTLGACVDALMNGGAKAVYAVTVGRHIDKTQAISLSRHKV